MQDRLTIETVIAAVTAAWSRCAPATWNRHVATAGSFVAYCRRRRWLTSDLAGDLERRPEPADGTKAIPLAELERWRREGSGPPWYKSGRRVLYKREEVERWRREQDRK